MSRKGLGEKWPWPNVGSISEFAPTRNNENNNNNNNINGVYRRGILLRTSIRMGAWGSAVVKVLCYKSEGPGIDSRCRRGFFRGI
jgi:hypothetical protein